MTNKITHAPQAVIEELDKLVEEYGDGTIYGFLSEISRNDTLANFVYHSNSDDGWLKWEEKRDRENAIINHYLDIEKLLPEREPRWYVEKVAPWSSDTILIYAMRTGALSETAVHGRAIFEHVVSYENGISKRLADAIVDEIGGTPQEIK
ncbi:hypothetical protein OIT44_03855 [Weissella ceti]|uniref:Uncharacterized protein n=1 Tax=Weissella ceti TaxID=759620 RepID=A0ABT3E459_9LACO|nr:hypothetical protein [Weissella ceti]MCW0953208.1 hypothetical protein [Weissella ceti]QVK12725.1 hypothetical protein KHQ31_03615 [Weissella ceti]